MRELRFDGLSQDSTRLLLTGNDGQKYSLLIDDRVAAAVRRDRARISQVELQQAGALRPREIQARIRAGATAEDVAASSGLPVAHVRRFEGPVLTERSWVAHQAQATEVRRPGGDLPLGEMVAERLEEHGVDPDDVTWDAWRRDDGLWVVIATFPMGPGTLVATWTYDAMNRTMTVADENARQLSAVVSEGPLRLGSDVELGGPDDRSEGRGTGIGGSGGPGRGADVIDLARADERGRRDSSAGGRGVGTRSGAGAKLEPDLDSTLVDGRWGRSTAGVDDSAAGSASEPAVVAGASGVSRTGVDASAGGDASATGEAPRGDALAEAKGTAAMEDSAESGSAVAAGSDVVSASAPDAPDQADTDDEATDAQAASAAGDSTAVEDHAEDESPQRRPSKLPSGLAALFENPAPPKRGSKPAVPSFDDILFGPGPASKK